MTPGQIVILNGAPRSGKSSIVHEIQVTFDGIWLNLGVDVSVRNMTPERFRPGIGLRPGNERPDLSRHIPVLYAGLYEAIAAQSRVGLNVVVDVGHYQLEIFQDCLKRLSELPVLVVGVRCPIDVIMARRALESVTPYVQGTPDNPYPEPVIRWQNEVHLPGIYDLEVDTSELDPAACARRIKELLADRMPVPSARDRILRYSG